MIPKLNMILLIIATVNMMTLTLLGYEVIAVWRCEVAGYTQIETRVVCLGVEPGIVDLNIRPTDFGEGDIIERDGYKVDGKWLDGSVMHWWCNSSKRPRRLYLPVSGLYSEIKISRVGGGEYPCSVYRADGTLLITTYQDGYLLHAQWDSEQGEWVITHFGLGVPR